MNKYEVIIYWSESDNVFVAEIPELKGCTAHGETQDEALQQVNAVAKEWLEFAKAEGWNTPEPRGKLVYALSFSANITSLKYSLPMISRFRRRHLTGSMI